MATAHAQETGVQSSRAEVAQRVAEAQQSQGYVITSSVEGTITALTARVGQVATPQQSLMTIVPAHANIRAQLYVPTSAAGFLKLGQEVRLGIDAFPYQQYGTLTGRIVQISSVAIPKAISGGGTIPVYLVTVDLPEKYMAAFGQQHVLLPGMTISARIVTRRQTFAEWLFEPIFAVSKR
jgi:membrane fusion protein